MPCRRDPQRPQRVALEPDAAGRRGARRSRATTSAAGPASASVRTTTRLDADTPMTGSSSGGAAVATAVRPYAKTDDGRTVGAVTADEWLEAFARAIGSEPPSTEEAEHLLDLAGIAAHASERRAAPIACWLAARAGMAPADAVDVARRVAP
jgi:hypothetical protein